MPELNSLPTWFRPAASATGLLLLWMLESLAGIPRRDRRVSRLRHAARNLSLAALNGVLLAVTGAVTTAAVLEWTADRQLGLLYWLPAVVGLRSAAALLLLDLWSWFWHWACHRSAFLWRFHRVHHSDPDMDVTTAFRFHPGELFCSSLARVPVICVLGVSATELLFYEAVLLASVQFHHSALAGGFWDERLRRLIVTPAMHRIHHARERQLTNSNYASLLSCWDRFFGTWQPPMEASGGREDAIPSCGLAGTDGETWQSIAGMTVSPLRGDPVMGESG